MAKLTDHVAPYIANMSREAKRVLGRLLRGTDGLSIKDFLKNKMRPLWLDYIAVCQTPTDVAPIVSLLDDDGANAYSALADFWTTISNTDALDAYKALLERNAQAANELVIAVCHILYSATNSVSGICTLLTTKGFTFLGDRNNGWMYGRAEYVDGFIKLRSAPPSSSSPSSSSPRLEKKPSLEKKVSLERKVSG